jgi:hypothetical protein
MPRPRAPAPVEKQHPRRAISRVARPRDGSALDRWSTAFSRGASWLGRLRHTGPDTHNYSSSWDGSRRCGYGIALMPCAL